MSGEIFLNGRVTLHCGDCLEVMDSFEENSFDSCVTDPPYHLASIVRRFGEKNAAPAKAGKTGAFARASAGFMGKKWDGGDIAFQSSTWEKVFRVLKPGAYIVAFSSSRTYEAMAPAISGAGFVTHPLIGQLLESSTGISDFLDSLNSEQQDAFGRLIDRADFGGMLGWIFGQGFPKAHRITHSGLSDLDRLTGGWEGWRYGGQALKPALEPIYVGQKPFSEINGAANVQRWGVGALNIDACRVGTDDTRKVKAGGARDFPHEDDAWEPRAIIAGSECGRWPANVMTDGSAQVFDAFPDTDGGGDVHNRSAPKTNGVYGDFNGNESRWAGFADTGSAARFFWSSKAGADDRLGSKHPTVKPVDIIEELATLVTPPGGRILDLFAGTGTLGEAAYRRGFSADLIEREPEYQADIRRRMALVLAGPEERKRESIKAKIGDIPFEAGSLFAAIQNEAAE